MLHKKGSSLKIAEVVKDVTLPVTPSVTPEVSQNVTKVPETNEAGFSGEVVEKLDKKNFLYFKARAISAGETSGPNGNGDWFSLEELIKSYGTFKGRGLYLNHDSADVTKAVGKVIDAYLTVDPESKDIWVECLCKVDRVLNPTIVRQIESGLIDSVSMGCTCDTAVCSVCEKKMHRKEDFCEHITNGLLRDFEWKGKMVKCYSINSGITFTELSLVSVPADGKAKIHQLIASLKSNDSADKKDVVDIMLDIYASLSAEDKDTIKKEISAVMDGKLETAGAPAEKLENETQQFRRSDNMDKEAGKTDPKQPEVDVKTTKDEQDCQKDLKAVDGLAKQHEKMKTTKEEQDGLKTVLQKMNALDYIQLLEHFKKEASDKDVKDIQRFTDKDYEKGTHARAEEIAKQTKSTKVDEPKLKETKSDIVDRTAELKAEAGKHGAEYSDQFPEKAKHEEELDKIRKSVLERVSEKVTSKLFVSSVLNEIKSIVGDEAKAKIAFSKLFPGMLKQSEAKPGGKEHYYFTGAKEPKPVAIPTESDSIYRSEHQGEDPTNIPEDHTTADYDKQVAEGRKESKDQWDKDREMVKKDVEKNNAVEKSQKQLGFKASLDKKAELADSTWTVKNDKEEIVFTASLGQLWGETLPEVTDFAMSEVYGDYLVRKAEKGEDGLADLFKKVKKDEPKKDEPKDEGKKEDKKEDKKEGPLDMAPAGDLPPAAEAGPDAGPGEMDKEAPSEKAMNKLTELWDAAGMKGKMKQRKSDVPVYEFIVNILDEVIKQIGGKKDEPEAKETPAEEKSEKASKDEEKKEEKKAEQKPEMKSDRENALEAELAAERTKASLREKLIRCRATIESMVEKDMIEPLEDVVANAQKNGLGPIEARNRGLKAAVDAKMAEMLRMDEISFTAFNKLVTSMKKEASLDVLKTAPTASPMDGSLEKWFENLPWS